MSATIGLEDQGASTRSPGRAHGLFADTTPPSRQLLLDWLDQNGAYIHPSLQITEMEDGPGWRLTSKDNMEAFDLRECFFNLDPEGQAERQCSVSPSPPSSPLAHPPFLP